MRLVDSFRKRASERSPVTRRHLRLFSLPILVFALVWSGLYGVSAWNLAANGVEAEALVLKRSPDRGGGTELLVGRETAGGHVVGARFTEYSEPEKHQVGDWIRIRYLPSDPSIARQAEEPPFDPLFMTISIAFVLAAIGFLVYAWWLAPPDSQSRSSWRMRRRPASVIDPDSDG